MKKLALLLAVLTVAAMFAGCAKDPVTTPGTTDPNPSTPGTTDPKPSTPGTTDPTPGDKRDDVIVRVESTWDTFNPLKATLYVVYFEINQMYEALTWVDDSGTVTPVLAEDWKVSDDGKTYVFNIRKGVKFHNGEELKASDVAFTINEAKVAPAMQSYLTAVNNAEATGDYECTLHMDSPFAAQLAFLANIRILNEKFYKENDGNIDTISCGTGPYVLQQEGLDMNTYCKMTAFPDYWGDEPSIKNIEFKIIIDDTTAAVAYMAGEVDFLMTSASQYLEISADPDKYDFTNIPTKHTALFYMNHEKEPFSDVRVRKALSHATDKETIIQVAFEGFAAPAYLMADESCFGVDYDYAVKYEYDLDKAKELLTDAGYPDGVNLGTMLTIAGSYFDKCAVVFQSSLKSINCELELVGMDSTSMTPLTTTGNYEMACGGQSFSTDFAYGARQYCEWNIGTNNQSRYRNPEVDQWFADAEGETDPEVRKEVYGKIISTITEDAVNIPMFHKNLLFAWTKGLNCVVHPDSGMPYFVKNWSW